MSSTKTLYTQGYVFSTENNCNIIYEGERLLIHLMRPTTKKEKLQNMTRIRMTLYFAFTRELCFFFLKSRPLFNIFCCFCMFVNKHLLHLRWVYLKSKQCYNVKPLAYYIYVKTKILIDFDICISVPLK